MVEKGEVACASSGSISWLLHATPAGSYMDLFLIFINPTDAFNEISAM